MKKRQKLCVLAAAVLTCAYSMSAEASEDIKNNGQVVSGTIQGGTAEYGGGGAFNYAKDITIDNATFKNNKALSQEKSRGYGGGFANGADTYDGKDEEIISTVKVIKNSKFINNQAYTSGGGLDNNFAIKEGIINTLFEGNKTTYESGTDKEKDKTHGQGGAISNSGEINGDGILNSIFINNSSSRHGGAIVNHGSITKITGSTFKNNTSENGGAIANVGTINTIKNSTFLANSSETGGAIRSDKTITQIENTIFTNNTAKSQGGAIANIGTINTIKNSTFLANSSEAGGAIGLNKIVEKADTDDKEDIIVSAGKINTITDSKFESNSAEFGGAIYIAEKTSVENISNSIFKNNSAITTTDSKVKVSAGGAIFNADNTLNIKNSIFENNIVKTTGAGSGGAISSLGNLNIEDTDFIGNKVETSGKIKDSVGGAIILAPMLDKSTVVMNISAKNKNVIFKDNVITNGTDTQKNDIHLDPGAIANINAAHDKKVSFNGGISSAGSNFININNEETSLGTIEFNEKVQLNDIALHRGTLKTGAYTNGDSVLDIASLSVGGGTIDLSNDYIEEVKLSALNFYENADVVLDADLGTNAVDKFKTNQVNVVTDKIINIKAVNVLGDAEHTNNIYLPIIEGDDSSANIDAVEYIYTSKNGYITSADNTDGNTNLLLTRENDGGLVAATAIEPAEANSDISYTVTENENLEADLSPFNSNISSFIVKGSDKNIVSKGHKGFELATNQNLEIDGVLNFSGFSSEKGGVVYNKGGNVNIAKVAFENNSASGDGGVIYTTGGTVNLTDVSFKNNKATGKGSIIYASGGTVNINANEADVSLANTSVSDKNAQAKVASGDDNAIYLDVQDGQDVPVLNLNSMADRKISLSGIKGSAKGYTININKNSTNGGVVVFNQTVSNATANGGINLYSGTMKLAQDNLINNNALSLYGGNVDMINNAVSTMSLQTLNLYGPTNLSVDVDLFNANMDRIKANNYKFSDGGKINITNMNLLSDSDNYKTTIMFTGQQYGNEKLSSKIVNGVTTAKSALYTYNVNGSQQGDSYVFDFTRPGHISPNNTEAYVAPVATILGGYANQLNTYQTAFGTMDILTGMTPANRRALIKANNKVASSDVDENMTFSPTNMPVDDDLGIWFKPYTSIEKVRLEKNGPRVKNFMYGTLIGGDTGLQDLGNGWEGIANTFVGYTGSRQSYGSVGMFQNGVTIGGSGMLFKNNFFAGLTGNFAYSGVDAKTSMGSEDFGLISTGGAGKIGYNWALADGKFVVQPSFTGSYSFINATKYTNSYNAQVKGSALHAMQIAPGLKLIYNLPKSWQLYAGANYMWNLMDKTKFSVAATSLDNLSMRPYIEYGIGVQKKVGDYFTGYFDTTARGGGRNGIAFSIGARWDIGDNPRKKSERNKPSSKYLNDTKTYKPASYVEEQQTKKRKNHEIEVIEEETIQTNMLFEEEPQVLEEDTDLTNIISDEKTLEFEAPEETNIIPAKEVYNEPMKQTPNFYQGNQHSSYKPLNNIEQTTTNPYRHLKNVQNNNLGDSSNMVRPQNTYKYKNMVVPNSSSRTNRI